MAVAGSELVRLSLLLAREKERPDLHRYAHSIDRAPPAPERTEPIRITSTCNLAQNDILHVLQNACL